MRVLGPYFGLTLLLSVAPTIAGETAPADVSRSEATGVADPSTKQSGSSQLALDNRSAPVGASPAGAMAIAPAPVIEPGDEMFIGTGDGSNGFWVRP